jgi:hypothetical protein
MVRVGAIGDGSARRNWNATNNVDNNNNNTRLMCCIDMLACMLGLSNIV